MQRSIDKHARDPFIESTAQSLILCERLLNALEDVSKRGLELGKAKCTVTMAGSQNTTTGQISREESDRHAIRATDHRTI